MKWIYLYFVSDNTECLLFERYRDSQALLDHHKNLGTRWTRFFGHALGVEKYAERLARPELIERLKDSPAQVYKPRPTLC